VNPKLCWQTNVLSFAGIAPPAVRVYPIETHIAESMPRGDAPWRDSIAKSQPVPRCGASAHQPELRSTPNFEKSRRVDSELGHAPVHGEFVSGRVGRVEPEEEDGLGDLVRRPPALHRAHTDHLLRIRCTEPVLPEDVIGRHLRAHEA